MNEEREILKEQWKKVPSEIKAIILSPDFEKNIQIILTENNLPADKAKELENETVLLLIGLSGTDDYVDALGEIFTISQEKAEDVLFSVDRIILSPVKNSLISFIEKENAEEDETLANNLQQTTDNRQLGKSEIDNAGKEIVLENQNPFLPTLIKTTNNLRQTTFNQQQATNDREPDGQQPIAKEDKKIPNVTSAMAAEMGDLLNKPSNDIQPTTHNLQPENQEALENKTRQTTDNLQPTTYDKQQENQEVTETPREKMQQTTYDKQPTQTPIKPEDKLDTIVQKPRVEVEMVRRENNQQQTTSDRQPEKKIDPYRELVE